MSQNKSFYITTTLPYVNAEPHIGFALEILQADVLARWKQWELGDGNVFFNTGTDEHGQKIFEAATRTGEKVESYVEKYAQEFKKLKEILGLSDNLRFIRTTDERHIRAAQELWHKCKKDIYKKEFEGLYCVGCERFLTQRDLVNGKCSIHNTEPQLLREKNWFFRFSKYEKELLKYLEDPKVIIPDWRRAEAINFVKEGLEDFSISRDKSRLTWGIPVPNDDTQVIYVWFDALTSYISTLGWPDEKGDFKKFWQEGHTLQLAGKDQVRFQSLMWQAMLMSAGIKNTDQVFYHGFINSGGQKMSKSLGNVINPYDMVKKYGTDATRYLLLRHVHSTEDTDVTWGRLDEWYEAGLVNGLGNLVSRIMKLAEDNIDETTDWDTHGYNFSGYTKEKLDEYREDLVMDYIWSKIAELDKKIQDKKPWETKDKKVITDLVEELGQIAYNLKSFMPKTSEKIIESIKVNKKPENLFPRQD
ncbi:MAG: methionine--tRNA ligase [Candidatus Zambryskibacteria bacterium CG11_big_fil_rev_8_21_14_0_20_42_18]|uniref:Methionine--tRNA ligase n=1 Tax=Candidatus Zambryskibacteria bacterium CG_4_9_14_3_um_filter_42_15 TaxID=1975112 RepID=A0A2M7WSR4_9BACT|nr:MAG: methionine--tRNA ligase [Candidatus Zambryskibacteria bacterium CG11_big_fil_rev_8_21_14_0_20_42_18]PJA33039.1 MAG: methionine--tRNA ligase [Candidatus Zambryskibacteria bacterium CG_4_9_14_3_um_filter_42_15]